MLSYLRWLGASGLLTAILASPPGAWAPAPPVPPYDRAAPTDPPPPVPSEEGEVQGRGPVHEGYAQPPDSAPADAPVVTQKPPDPIPEVPPDQRPEGDNVIWTPGYWDWDADRGTFIWVTGCWRVVPPGRKWMPGYWAPVNGGYRWVQGFWAPATATDVYYNEAPPAPLETEPTVAAPDANSFWVPGCWYYRSRWIWRKGYWCPYQPGWVYCPPRWCWTPRGYLFCSAFWDRPLARRGCLFAPVW